MHGVFKLVPITSVPTRLKVVGSRWVWNIKAKGTYKGRLGEQGMLQLFGVDTPGVGPELLLNQPVENLLNEEEKRRYQGITGTVHVF